MSDGPVSALGQPGERQPTPDETITLPFNVPGLWGGFAEGSGLAKAHRSELTLEFVVKDSLASVLRSRMKEVRVPRAEIDFVRLKRGWFGAKVLIRVKSMKWLADLPECDNGQVTLHVARADRERAAQFVQLLES